MKRAITILLLCASLSDAGGWADYYPTGAVMNPAAHVSACMVVTLLANEVMWSMGMDKADRLWLAPFWGLMAGGLKEVVDREGGGFVDPIDLAADAVGSVLGCLIIWRF